MRRMLFWFAHQDDPFRPTMVVINTGREELTYLHIAIDRRGLDGQRPVCARLAAGESSAVP